MGYPLDGGSNAKKKVAHSIRGGLRASCCGECQEVQVRTGTECRGVHNVDGYCSGYLTNTDVVPHGSVITALHA